jgi:hypothetical protein
VVIRDHRFFITLAGENMAGWYQYGASLCFSGAIDLDTSVLKLILVGTGTPYVYNPDHTAVDDGSGNDIASAEINVSGYTPGWGSASRKTASITMQVDDANNKIVIAIADQTYTALGAGDSLAGIILVKEGAANDTQSIPIAYIDCTDTPLNGSDITLDFATLGAGGNLSFTVGSGLYTYGWMKVLDGTIDIDTTVLKLMIHTTATTYTYDADHTAVDAGGADDLVDAEANVTNYARGWGGSGRKTATITLQANNTDNRVDIAIGDLTWSALGGAANQTINGATLIKEGGSDDTTSIPLANFDLPNTITNGGDMTLDFATLGAGGNIQVSIV